MLKNYKNEILQTIKDCEFDPEDFSSDETETTFTITHLNTPLKFSFINLTNFHTFSWNYTTFSPNFLKRLSPEQQSFPGCVHAFKEWLIEHVEQYLKELTVPDLWKQLEDQKALMNYDRQDDDKATHFTDEQKKLIRMGLNEVLHLIKKEFQPSPDEIGLIVKFQ